MQKVAPFKVRNYLIINQIYSNKRRLKSAANKNGFIGQPLQVAIVWQLKGRRYERTGFQLNSGIGNLNDIISSNRNGRASKHKVTTERS